MEKLFERIKTNFERRITPGKKGMVKPVYAEIFFETKKLLDRKRSIFLIGNLKKGKSIEERKANIRKIVYKIAERNKNLFDENRIGLVTVKSNKAGGRVMIEIAPQSPTTQVLELLEKIKKIWKEQTPQEIRRNAV